MSKPTYRAVVIGATGKGGYGHRQHLAFQNIEQIKLVALADEDEAGRKVALAESGAARGYADYREMLRKEQPDIVSVCPRWLDQRLPMVLDSIQAGCHVYCEKPFAMTLEHGDQMVAAAEQAGVKIAVAHFHGAYLPGINALKDLIQNGRIGTLLQMNAHGKHDHRGGGEDMMDLGVHLFNLMNFFAGDVAWMSANVTAHGRAITANDVHEGTEPLGPLAGDRIDRYFAFKSSVPGFFNSRRNSVGVNDRYGVDFIGSEGMVSLRGGTTQNNLMIYPFPLWAPFNAQQTWQPLQLDYKINNQDEFLVAHKIAVLDLIRAIEHGTEPICSGKDGTKALEMVLAAYESQISGQRVDFPMVNRQHPLNFLQ